MTDYPALNAQLSALVHGVPHRVANLANAAALLYHTLEVILLSITVWESALMEIT